MPTIFSDDFNRANATSLGGNWTGSGHLTSNQAHGDLALGGEALAVNSTTATVNCLVEATITQAQLTASAGAGMGLVARYQATGGGYYYLAWIDEFGTNIRLYRVQAGAFTQMGTWATTALSDPVTLTLSCIEDLISVRVNGTQRIGVSNTSITSAGGYGFRVFNPAGIPGHRLDDFAVRTRSTPRPLLGISDDFEDGVRGAQWGVYSQGNGTGPVISESGGQLRLTPPVNNTTSSGTGYTSVATYDFTGKAIRAEIVTFPTANYENVVIGLEFPVYSVILGATHGIPNYYYSFANSTGSTSSSSAAWPAGAKYVRIEHDPDTNYIYLDRSADGTTWTNFSASSKYVPSGTDLTLARVILYAGSTQPTAAPAQMVLDNFNVSTVTYKNLTGSAAGVATASGTVSKITPQSSILYRTPLSVTAASGAGFTMPTSVGTAVGDLHVAVVTNAGTSGPAAPTGWTRIYSVSAGSGQCCSVFTAPYSAGLTRSFTNAASAAVAVCGSYYWSGKDIALDGAPVAATNTTNNTTLPTGAPTTGLIVADFEVLAYSYTSAATFTTTASGSTIDLRAVNSTVATAALGHNNTLALGASTATTAFSHTLSASNTRKTGVGILLRAVVLKNLTGSSGGSGSASGAISKYRSAEPQRCCGGGRHGRRDDLEDRGSCL